MSLKKKGGGGQNVKRVKNYQKYKLLETLKKINGFKV
jgi:hypothetical protein